MRSGRRSIKKDEHPTLGNGQGLSSAEAQARLKQFGPNAVVEEKAHPLKEFIKRFWALIPWLLEATIIIQLFLGESVEAAVIGGLLILNALLSFLQEEARRQAKSRPRGHRPFLGRPPNWSAPQGRSISRNTRLWRWSETCLW